jgi:hypothetical protein
VLHRLSLLLAFLSSVSFSKSTSGVLFFQSCILTMSIL